MLKFLAKMVLCSLLIAKSIGYNEKETCGKLYWIKEYDEKAEDKGLNNDRFTFSNNSKGNGLVEEANYLRDQIKDIQKTCNCTQMWKHLNALQNQIRHLAISMVTVQTEQRRQTENWLRAEREVRRQRNRSRRLQVYTTTQVQYLKWNLTNQTAEWTRRFESLEKDTRCLNENSGNKCKYQDDQSTLLDDPLANKQIRVAKTPKQRTTDSNVLDLEKDTNSNLRPSETSLAFHRQGRTLKAIPLVEKMILENDVKRGNLNIEESQPQGDDPKSRDVPIPNNFGKVTFQKDGSINIKLVDPGSEQAGIDHVLGSDPSSDGPTEETGPGRSVPPSDMSDPAGSSYASDTKRRKRGITDLKLWTYDDLLTLGRKASDWITDRNFKPKDCSQIDRWTQRLNPIQEIHPVNCSGPLSVFCHEGWILMQRNVDDKLTGSLRNWNDYKWGFGNIHDNDGQFWIGNEYLHKITHSGEYSLKIVLTGNTDQEIYDAIYNRFKVSSEHSGYKLQELSGSSGLAGDILGLFSSTSLVHSSFKTHEMHENTPHSIRYEDTVGGWWYPDLDKLKKKPSSFSRRSYFRQSAQFQRRGVEEHTCYTNLNAHRPWFCNLNVDQNGQKHYVSKVKMFIKIASQN